MTRGNIMEAMNGIGDYLIVEAAEKLGFLNGSAAIVKGRKAKGPSAFSRFMNSGWGVAAVCALVAVSVMGGIIWAGHQPGKNPPVVTPEETTAPFEIESENEDYIGEDQTEVMIRHGNKAIYPRKFFMWSGSADGFGFEETIRQVKIGTPILPRVYYAKDESISPCELTLPKNGSLRGVSFYDDDMNETAIAYDGEFHYESFLKDLPVGRHHVCLYIEYTEDGKAVSGADYAFTVVVTEKAEEVTKTEAITETETETSQPTDLRYFQFPLVNAKDTTSYISLPDMTAEGEQAIEFFVVPSDTETPELTSAYKIHVSKDFPMNIQLVVIKSKEGEGACILYRMEKAQPDEYDMIEADGTVVLECCVLDFDRTAEYGYYSRYYSSNDPNWGDYRFTYVNGTKVSMAKHRNNLRYLEYAEYFIRSNGYDDPEKYEYTVLYSYIDGVETVNTPSETLPEFPCTIFNAYNEPDMGN